MLRDQQLIPLRLQGIHLGLTHLDSLAGFQPSLVAVRVLLPELSDQGPQLNQFGFFFAAAIWSWPSRPERRKLSSRSRATAATCSRVIESMAVLTLARTPNQHHTTGH